MEFNDKNVSDLANLLTMKKFNESMKSVSDYMKIAEDLVKNNPDKSIDELAELYENQCQEAEMSKQTDEREDEEK